MTKRLFVGGLAWATDENALREAFEQFGEVKDAAVITDPQTGKSRGFGFVTYNEEADATRAIEQMNGSELGGRRIAVNVAQERQQRSGPRPGGGGGFRAVEALAAAVVVAAVVSPVVLATETVLVAVAQRVVALVMAGVGVTIAVGAAAVNAAVNVVVGRATTTTIIEASSAIELLQLLLQVYGRRRFRRSAVLVWLPYCGNVLPTVLP